MLSIVQLSFDLPESIPPDLQDILDRHPELEVDRMPLLRRRTTDPGLSDHRCVPAYDPYLRTSTCLTCGNRVEDCPGWPRQP